MKSRTPRAADTCQAAKAVLFAIGHRVTEAQAEAMFMRCCDLTECRPTTADRAAAAEYLTHHVNNSF